MNREFSRLMIAALLSMGVVPLHAQARSTAPTTAATPQSVPAPQQPATKFPASAPGAHASSPLALPDLTATSDGIVIGGQRIPWGGSVTLSLKSSAGADDKSGNVIYQPSAGAGGVAKQNDLLNQKETVRQRQEKLSGLAKDPTQLTSSCRFPYAFTAQNIGGGPLPPSVFYLLATEDGRGLAGGTSPDARLDPLGPGQQKKITGQIDLLPGLHTLRLALDQTRQVTELNRANNNFQITVNVNCAPVRDKAVDGALGPSSSKEQYMSPIRNLVADQGLWETRVRAKGLDPKDPNLRSKLASVAAQDTRVFTAQHQVSALHIVPATLPKVPTLPALRQSASTNFTTARPTAPPPPPAKPDSLASTLAEIKKSDAMVSVTPEIRGLFFLDVKMFSNREAEKPTGEWDPTALHYIVGNWDQLFPQNRPRDARDNATATLDLGDCGRLDHELEGWNRGPTNAPRVLVIPRSVPGNHPQPGLLTVRVHTNVSNSLQLTKVIPSQQIATASLAIAATAPHISGDGGIGLQPSHLALAGNGDRVSTAPENQGGQGGSGTDTIGRGVFLMNGYTATARIVSAHSYMDAPNDYQPDSTYRGATIVQQPQNGRLETKVAWHYAAGESLDYVIEWELKGTYGVRPLSTMPRSGTCGD
ncbi:MAG TPA: hypothetical protein VKL40_11945 [Candidatus Angelobacter sp.]|nr:hypothetical protein [Candidatus Angelobacter sp.]